MNHFPKLFSPFKIGSMELKNRIVMPAMETHLCDEEGFVTDAIISYYSERIKGGVGYVTVENTAIDPAGRLNDGMLCIFEDKFTAGLKKLTDAVHEVGRKDSYSIEPRRQRGINLLYRAGHGLTIRHPQSINQTDPKRTNHRRDTRFSQEICRFRQESI